MIALDTNVVVRVLTRDDPEQTAAAERVMNTGRLWLAKTVLLEVAWVLRHTYGLDREAIADGLRTLLGYRRLQVEDRPAALRALAWYGEGLDFADALHLASAGPAITFATFDRTLAKQALRLATAPNVELLGARRAGG